ncbi:MAG: response regulator receiver modulated diguanylate phosphodiesterase [Pseudonocardiales bacterium]|nr:response regulator receiver modulated diguanylate phosphodiesterase [Pseudonocardiales bacterium]
MLEAANARSDVLVMPASEKLALWASARVLIIDDEPVNVRLLERIMSGVGAGEVRSTTDPRLAVQLFTEFEPDVVLLDLRMPYKDGFVVLQEINKVLAPDEFLPVLVLTADGSGQAMERALSEGAADYLTKPFDRVEVLLLIQNLLERRQLDVRLREHNLAMQAELRAQARLAKHRAERVQRRLKRMHAILESGGPRMVFQPIWDLGTGALLGVEALARFDAEPVWGPERWFIEAAELGLGVELEVTAVRTALDALDAIPAHAYLAVNVSAPTVTSGLLEPLISAAAKRIVLEVTEHSPIPDYDALIDALLRLRRTGVRVAIDDAGGGYAALQHILQLNPDIIKLDLDLTRGIENDPARRALASALVHFAQETAMVIVAEGIETVAALDILRTLGVSAGQGDYLAGPAPASELKAFAAGTSLIACATG